MGMRDGESENLRLLEALLFAADAPRTPAELARHLPDGADVPALLEALQQHYAGRGVTLQRVGEAWAFRTAPDLADRLRVEQVETRKLSRAAVETLAIIAYHQPVTRAEIEEIRGVGLSKGTLDTLLEAADLGHVARVPGSFRPGGSDRAARAGRAQGSRPSGHPAGDERPGRPR
jgi:segregation and condensation protein B